MPGAEALIVLTTLSSADEAVTLVRALLDRRLIACGTLLPGARSLYRWEDRLADEQEVVVLLKTQSPRLADLHPYKVPELLALPVRAGNAPYLEWLVRETALATT